MNRRTHSDSGFNKVVTYTVYALVLLVFVFPFWNALVTSLSAVELRPGQMVLWPQNATFEHFVNLFRNFGFGANAYNSFVVVVFALSGQIVVSVLAAFALGRMSFRGSSIVMLLFISTLMITEELVMVPLYLVLRRLPVFGVNLLESYPGMILPLVAWAFPIIILTEFIRDIPRELDESAMIDGAKDFTIYTRIILPLVLPGLGTCLVFGFVMIWNQYLLPLIVSSDGSLVTLPVALRSLRYERTNTEVAMPLWMAGSIATVAPSVVIYLVLQRFFLAGLTRGSVKG